MGFNLSTFQFTLLESEVAICPCGMEVSELHTRWSRPRREHLRCFVEFVICKSEATESESEFSSGVLIFCGLEERMWKPDFAFLLTPHFICGIAPLGLATENRGAARTTRRVFGGGRVRAAGSRRKSRKTRVTIEPRSS